MKIAVCDDMERLRKGLTENIKEYYGSGDLKIEEFEDGKDLLKTYEVGKYDIIFLDFYMKEMNGKATADSIREVDQRVMIVFATSEEAYFFHDVASLRVDKPLTKEDYDKVMKIYAERKTFPRDMFFYFAENGAKRCRFVKNVTYIHERDVYIDFFHVMSDEPVVLENENVIFTTKDGYQINIDHIKKMEWCRVLFLGREKIELNWRDYRKLKKRWELYKKKQEEMETL